MENTREEKCKFAFVLNSVVGDCVICVTGIFEEIQEEDLLDVFSEFGAVKNLHFNLDKRTGYAKGYAFIEYETKDNASAAIEQMNGKEVAGKEVKIDWAFKEEPRRSRGGHKHRHRKRENE